MENKKTHWIDDAILFIWGTLFFGGMFIGGSSIYWAACGEGMKQEPWCQFWATMGGAMWVGSWIIVFTAPKETSDERK